MPMQFNFHIVCTLANNGHDDDDNDDDDDRIVVK